MSSASPHHESSYTKPRVFLHWLSAIVIFWASFTGCLAAYLPPKTPVRAFFDLVNPQITTLFIPFFIWRLGFYLRARPWASWPSSNSQERLALLVHATLYIIITVVLATGLLMMPKPWRLLGVFPLPALGVFYNYLFFLHKLSCVALVGLVALHLAAVCFHLYQGHNILKKMRLRRGLSSNSQNHAVIARLDA